MYSQNSIQTKLVLAGLHTCLKPGKYDGCLIVKSVFFTGKITIFLLKFS